MSRGLEDVRWGGPALTLLKQCSNLDKDKPAVMIIRHSEAEEKLALGRQLRGSSTGVT